MGASQRCEMSPEPRMSWVNLGLPMYSTSPLPRIDTSRSSETLTTTDPLPETSTFPVDALSSAPLKLRDPLMSTVSSPHRPTRHLPAVGYVLGAQEIDFDRILR